MGRPEVARPAEFEQIVRAVLDEVRPNPQHDGGCCEFVGIDGNKIMVTLTGACVFCQLASATLEGIQARLVERLGKFVRLVPPCRGTHQRQTLTKA